ncbi:vWA domain-containing protein [Chthonobacter albigriseus]|uniref:vWA domain-containing protein n=1 Tax=Chthonobacter albigriseus TaxID=1683161 RepID=UPI0015EE7DDA|nr:VWA domain-containing protein [Chthonobacter albigriseus]
MNNEAVVIPPSSRLPENVVHFARLLRRAGMPVGPASVVEAVEAMTIAGVGSREDVYWTLHAIFVTRREHHILFDEAFRTFWRSRGLVEKMLQVFSPVAPPRAPLDKPKAGAARLAHALFGDAAADRQVERPEVEIDARFTVSDREILQKKDFAQMSADEIALALQAVRGLVMPVDKVPVRRRMAAPRAREIDLRRTMQASLRAGGAIIPLAFREPKQVHPPIVALLDISGSMTQYSRLFLHFLHALSSTRRVTTFLFGTRLTNVTRQMRMKDPDEALIACTNHVVDWSGGTRIGEALHLFNKEWSRRVMSGGPIVLLITDGLERDDVAGLAQETDRLHRSCRRLVWLNPLLRFEGFEARAAGVKAMLPHVDEFRPIHNLDAVKDLCGALAGDDAKRFDPRKWLRQIA